MAKYGVFGKIAATPSASLPSIGLPKLPRFYMESPEALLNPPLTVPSPVAAPDAVLNSGLAGIEAGIIEGVRSAEKAAVEAVTAKNPLTGALPDPDDALEP